MASDDIIVTSDYSNLSSGAIRGRVGRTNASGGRGRARVSVEIISEPIVHNFDELQLGKKPAAAIATALRRAVEGISEPVSLRTLETRKYQEAAYGRGEAWAKARFGGGRMADTPPRQGEARAFNHSGRFAKSLVATENKTEKSWTVNVAANRLDPRTSRTAGEFAFITRKLRELVPEFDDPRKLADHPLVRAALSESVSDLIQTARNLNQQLRAELGSQVLSLLGRGARVVLGG